MWFFFWYLVTKQIFKMKALLLTFSLVLSTVFSLWAQGNIPQPTHLIVKYAQIPGSPLENSDEGFIYYDNNGHIYETKANRWAAGNWILDNREYYTLNAQGLPTQILRSNWDATNSILVPRFRTSIKYHPSGQENYRKLESWIAITEVWETESITISTFSNTDKVLELTNESYTDGVLTFVGKYNYTYDVSDRELQEIYQETNNNGNLQNYLKTDYLYTNADDEFDQSISSNWDENFSVWLPNLRSTQTVTNAQRLILEENWDGAAWQANVRTTTNYDNNGQDTLYSVEYWDSPNLTWVQNSKYESYYNNDLSISQVKFFFAGFSTQTLLQVFQVDYDYGTYLVSVKTAALLAKVSVSPNPTTNFVQVQLDGSAASMLTLFDVHGKVVAQTAASSNTTTLSLLGQPAGTYFLRVEQGGAVKTLPVVKR